MRRLRSVPWAACRLYVLPAAALAFLSWVLPCAERANAQTTAEWTFMVYLDGDNNLEAAAIEDFLEMAEVGSGASVNVVVQFDRTPQSNLGQGYSNYPGNPEYDWYTCKRFRVYAGSVPLFTDQEPGAYGDLGEVNMGDPTTLTDFIDWAVGKYPANHYALVLWNHGTGWMTKGDVPRTRPSYKYICDDETSGDALTLRELRSALANASVDIDLVGFDACVMGMLEVAYELRDAGPSGAPEIVVFSEEAEENLGWPYDDILSDLKAADPPMTPTELATAIVDDYNQFYVNLEVQTEVECVYTMSAVKMSEVGDLGTAVSNMADSLIANWSMNPSTVKASAQVVIDSIDTAIVHELHDEDIVGAGGMSIYFPSLLASQEPDYDASTLDFADTAFIKWASFLYEFHTSMAGSWVCDARRPVQEFDEDSYVDLRDFCDRLVNHAPGPYGVDFITKTATGVQGTARNWKDNDQCWQYNIVGFSFPFYGQDYDSFWVCSNGYLDFTSSVPDEENTTEQLKSSVRIAPLWVDLVTTDGDIYVHEGVDGSTDYVCVRWDAKDRWVLLGETEQEPASFEAVLYEDGRIQFNYELDHAGLSAAPTVGISAGDGVHYELSLYDSVYNLFTDDTDVYTPNVPAITIFTATPDTKIISGEPVTLTWMTDNMVSVSIDNGVGDDLGGTGSVELYPTETTTYTLTAVDTLGSEHTASVTVPVTGLTLTFPTGGERVVGDDTSTVAITWTSSEFEAADQVKIRFDNGEGGGYVELATVDDTGSWDWTVPALDLPAWADPSDPHQCTIEISHAADGAPLDESGLFSVHADADKDGLPDTWESHYSLDDPAGHADADQLTNLEEFLAGTDPTDEDSDDDMLLDDFEVAHAGLDPLDSDTNDDGTLDGADNNDSDGLTNLEEQSAETDPNDEDTDDDELPDDWEYQYVADGLDPTDAWSGRDPDTEPRDDEWDLDGDGVKNYLEWQNGTDPTDPLDPPPAGKTRSGSDCAAGGFGGAAGLALWALAAAALRVRSRRRRVRG